jgi:hypothetical protein
VTVLSACNAWAVGFTRTGSERQTLIEHWDGASWTVVPSPSPGTGNNELRGVRAASASDVWAVGIAVMLGGPDQVLIEHWDGTSWTVSPGPSLPTTGFLGGVRVVSAGNVWAVGSTLDPVSGRSQTLVLNWNGHSWTRVPSPNPGPAGTEGTLAGVAATSASNAWAVGFSTTPGDGETTPTVNTALILRWNGRAWATAKIPHPGTSSSLAAVGTTSASDAWAVGSFATSTGAIQPLILHWNGTKWTQVATPHPGTSSLTGVAATSAGNAWAVGTVGDTQTLILRWNGRAWSRAASANPGTTFNGLLGVAASSASSAWAVGFSDTGANPQQTLAFHCC